MPGEGAKKQKQTDMGNQQRNGAMTSAGRRSRAHRRNEGGMTGGKAPVAQTQP